MRTFIMIILLASFVVAGGFPLEAFAQGGQRQQDRMGDAGQQRQGVDRNPLRDKKGDRPGREVIENFRRLEQLRMMKLLDLLQLDREMENGFVERFKEHHRNMFKIMRKQKRKIDELADGLRKDKLSDTEILEMVEELNQIEQNKNRTMTEFLNELEGILTPEQLGKIYVFQARFGQEVFEKMQKFNKR